MFEVGNLVVHPRYGPAIVEEIRVTQYQNETRRYYCLRLTNNNDKSVIMIREDAIDVVGLRTQLLNVAAIRKIMDCPPVEFDEDAQLRQKYIRNTMASVNPDELVGLLRDLCWRGQENRLSPPEIKARKDLLGILESELSVGQDVSALTAQNDLKMIIDAAMELHQTVTHDDASLDAPANTELFPMM